MVHSDLIMTVNRFYITAVFDKPEMVSEYTPRDAHWNWDRQGDFGAREVCATLSQNVITYSWVNTTYGGTPNPRCSASLRII